MIDSFRNSSQKNKLKHYDRYTYLVSELRMVYGVVHDLFKIDLEISIKNEIFVHIYRCLLNNEHFHSKFVFNFCATTILQHKAKKKNASTRLFFEHCLVSLFKFILPLIGCTTTKY